MFLRSLGLRMLESERSFQVKRAIDKMLKPEHRTPKYKALGLLVVASYSAPCWLEHVIRCQHQGSMSHHLR